MSSALEEYKNTYYKWNCHPEKFSWFDGWEYLAYTSHALSLVLIPLNIYGGYCILYQTPKRMEPAKWFMFNLHVWTSLLDVLISSMLTPYLFLPAMCGLTVGVFNWLGVHQLFQTFCAQFALAAVGVALVLMFENRHNVVANDRFVLTGKKSRMVFYVINYGYASCFMAPTFFNQPNQEEAKLKLLEIVPCPTPLYFEPNMYVLMDHEGRAFIQAQCTTLFCFLILQGSFFVLRTIYFLKVPNLSLSENTRKLQKKFFKSICIQVIIPIFIVIVPILYCGSSIEWYWYYQAFTNTAVICISFHGMSSTLAIILIYEPYRTYTGCLIKRIVWMKTSTTSPISVVTPIRSRRVTNSNSLS